MSLSPETRARLRNVRGEFMEGVEVVSITRADLDALLPREITTPEELDALPFESVIIDDYGTPHVCEKHMLDGSRNEWRMSGMGYLLDSDGVLLNGPATVIHTPEATR